MPGPLSSTTPQASWNRLLQIEESMSSNSLKRVVDGSGTNSALLISESGVNIDGSFSLVGTQVQSSALQINKLFNGNPDGQVTPSKAVVPDADGRLNFENNKFIKGAILEGLHYRFFDHNEVLSSGNAIQATGNYHRFKLVGNVTLGLTTSAPSGTSVGKMNIITQQDEIGGRTLTWPGSVRWPVGESGWAATGANRITIFEVFTYDNGGTWLGRTLAENIV